jgi:hypothetical protein
VIGRIFTDPSLNATGAFSFPGNNAWKQPSLALATAHQSGNSRTALPSSKDDTTERIIWANTDDTRRVIGERRLALLRNSRLAPPKRESAKGPVSVRTAPRTQYLRSAFRGGSSASTLQGAMGPYSPMCLAVASAAVGPTAVKSTAVETAMKSGAVKPHAVNKGEVVEIVETVPPKDTKSDDHVGGVAVGVVPIVVIRRAIAKSW